MAHLLESKPTNGFPAEGDGSYNEVFRGLPLTHFTKPSGAIQTILSDASVADAISILANAKILAAPVRNNDVPDSATWAEKYLGVLDFNSVIHWMMGKTWGSAPTTLDELKGLKAAFKTTKVSDLFLEGGRTPFVPIDLDQNTFLDVMIFLGKYGIHRVWPVENNEIVNVVTQSGILEVLANNLGSFEAITKTPMQDLGLGVAKSVVSVTLEDTFWEAFRKIYEHGISGVPVVGENGEVLGNISSRDLRQKILDPVQFATLAKPIGEFFTKGLSVFTVKETDSLGDVVRRFQETRVHRLYVVDGAQKPISVVSLRDVLAQFVREPTSEDGESAFLAFFK